MMADKPNITETNEQPGHTFYTDGTCETVMRSEFTGKWHKMTHRTSPDQMRAWYRGELIQNAMPHLALNEREFLLTGITPNEWEAAFKTED